jgi:hypothetical protein
MLAEGGEHQPRAAKAMPVFPLEASAGTRHFVPERFLFLRNIKAVGACLIFIR